MSSTARVPVRALRAIADAVSAERSTSYATTEVGRAALLVALRDEVHASPALAAQLARVQADTPMSTSIGVGPGASVVHNAGPVFRAAYLIRAAQRIGSSDDPATQTAAEQRYLRQHQNAQMARELGAMRMDAARAAYGRTLGWYSRNDDRVTAECRAANGKNFDPTHPPGIGLPGIGPHVGCRCTPGPPHEGAAFMPGAPSNVTALPGTTVREPAHLPGDDVISASVELVSGDASPFSSSRSSNWVAKAGGLPPRVRAIARAIRRKHPDWPLSRCIATAINAVKYSAATGDSKLPGRQNERPSTVAAHGAAAARWSAMKASTHAHTAEGAPMLDLAKKAAKPKTTPDGKEVEGDGLTYDPGSKSFHPTTDAETASTKHPHVPKGSRQGGQFAKKQQADQKKQAAAETKKTKQQAAAQKKAAAATVATAKAKTATEKKQAAEKAKAARAALAAAKAAAPKKTTAAKKTAAPKATAPKSTSTTTTKVTTGPKGTTQTTTRTVKATAPTATAIGLAYGDGPLVTTTMMKDAIACVPKAKDPAKAKHKCIAMAKHHGLTRMLPASWVPCA